MMQADNEPPKQQLTEVEPSLLNLKESIGGITELADKPLVKIEKGIVSMDQGFRSLVNQMGAGENMSSAIKKNLAGATEEVIKLGGEADSAFKVQLETLTTLGRNVTLSKELTVELFAASQVTGKSTKELQDAFLDVGMSLKDISSEMLKVREVSTGLGVNAKMVSSAVVSNMDKLNRFGFQGGIEGLARMAAKAQTLRVSMDSTFKLADDLMSPERAIELAASLQRLGATTTDLVDPLKLMDLAQNNVPELQKQLGEMFKTYTYFDEKTKSFQIMPGARRQLREIAGELNMDIKEVERMALGTADLDKKLSEISFAGFNVDQDTREMIANMATMDSSGTYKIQTSEVGADGKPISKSIQEIMDQFGGDSEKIKEYLTGIQEKQDIEADPQKKMVDLAGKQLDTLTAIKQANEALAAAPGLMVGSSKLGEQILESNRVLNEAINKSLSEKIGPQNKELQQKLDKGAEGLETGIQKAKEGDYKAAYQEISKASTDVAKALGEAIVGGAVDALEKIGDVTGLQNIDFEGIDVGDDIKKKLEKYKKKEEGSDFELPKSEEGGFELPKKGEDFELPKKMELQEIKTSTIKVEKSETSEQETKPTGEVKGETIINPAEDPQLLANVEKIRQLYEQGLVGEPLASAGNEVLFKQGLQPEIKEGLSNIVVTQETPLVESGINQQELTNTATQPETVTGVNNLEKTAVELGVNQEELTNIVPPVEQPETKLLINTSEVETLNVKNLNIGPELIKLLGTTKEVKEGESVDVQIQKLIDEGLVGEPMASTGNEVVFKPNTQESLDVEGISQTSPSELNPEVTPTQVPNIDIESGLPELTDELPSVQKGKQKTRGGFTKTKPSFSEMEYGSKAPSQYESFKKVLEESYGGEIIGTGAEAFVRTPEMIAEAKKNAEFIGEYEPSGITPKKEEDEDIIKLRKEMEDEASLKEKEDSYYNNLSELYKEISNIEKKGPIEGDNEKILKSLNDRVNKTIADIENLSEEETPEDKIESIGLIEDKGLAPIKPTLASLPIPEKEEKQPLGKRLKEGIGGIKEKGKGLVGEIKEKIKGEKPEEKPISAVPETQEEYVVKDKDGNIIGTSIDERAAKLKGESKTKSTESMGGFTVEKQTVTPTVPETPSVGVEKAVTETEEKQPLGKRLKEGIGDLAQKGKEKVKEKVELVRKEIDEVLYPEEQVNKIETPETPAVGVEKAAAEAEEKTPFKERLKEGIGNLAEKGKEKFQDVKEKIKETKEEKGPIGERLKKGVGEIFDKGKELLKPKEEETKIEPVKQDMFPLSKGFEGSFTEVKDGKLVMRDPYEMLDEKNKKEKDKIGPISESKYREGLEEIYGKEAVSELSPMSEPPESGYLKMLKENDEKATPFLTSKSGKPVNLDETEKIGLKGIEGFGKKEKSSSFGLDMKMFEQKLPEVPKASLEKTKTDNIDVKSIEDSVPKVEDTRSALEKVSLTASEDEGFESGLIEPAEVFPTENETRQNKEEEERKDRSFAYLEELRLREQTPTVPETPAKGIEKIAQLGQKFEGKIGGLKEKLFGKKSTQLGEYVAETDYGGTDEYEVEDVSAEETSIPEPITTEQGGYGETAGETPGEIKPGENVMTVEGGSPIVIEIKHTFVNAPSNLDTSQFIKAFETNQPLRETVKSQLEKMLGY